MQGNGTILFEERYVQLFAEGGRSADDEKGKVVVIEMKCRSDGAWTASSYNIAHFVFFAANLLNLQREGRRFGNSL